MASVGVLTITCAAFINQLLISEKEERLVASVVDLRDEDRSAHIRFRIHEPGGKAVREAWARDGSFQIAEEQPVLHSPGTGVIGLQPVGFIRSALFHYGDIAAGRISLLSRPP